MELTAVARALAVRRWWAPTAWGPPLVFGLLVVYFVTQVAWPAARQPTHGFSAYYAAARGLLDGADVSRYYDDAAFRQLVDRYSLGASDIFYVNPPTTALLFLPLAWLPPAEARTAWIALNLIGIGLALAWLARQASGHRVRSGYVLALGALVLLGFPLAENTRFGQVYVGLLLLTLLVWVGTHRRRDALLAGALVALVLFKLAGLPFLLLLLGQRRWRALAWTVGLALLVVGASWPWLGAAWGPFLTRLAQSSREPEAFHVAYESLPGMARHLFSYDPLWNPAPALRSDGPWGTILAAGLVLAALGVTVWLTGRARSQPAVVAAYAALGLIVAPLSQSYHYLLLLLPIGLLVRTWVRPESSGVGQAMPAVLLGSKRPGWPVPLFGLALGLWAIRILNGDPASWPGWQSLLAYPQLYAGVLVWLLALVYAAHSTPAANPAPPASAEPRSRAARIGRP